MCSQHLADQQEVKCTFLDSFVETRLVWRTLKVKVKSLSCDQLFATPWTAAYQAPLSLGFSRQEYWSGLPLPPPGDLPDPGSSWVFPTQRSNLGLLLCGPTPYHLSHQGLLEEDLKPSHFSPLSTHEQEPASPCGT